MVSDFTCPSEIRCFYPNRFFDEFSDYLNTINYFNFKLSSFEAIL